MPTISHLYVYPIKSCGGVRVERATVVPGGLEGDRRYMLVDEAGVFITRRKTPRLCLASVALDGDCFVVNADGKSLALPLLPRPEAEPQVFGERVSCTVWSDSVHALVHEAGSAWFSTFLGQNVRLLYMPDEALRKVNPERAQPGDVVSFADGYPLLLTTEASLDDLNNRLDVPIGMERFRPNVVVTGTKAYEEDSWTRIELQSVPFDVPKGCDRCVMTTLEEGTGRGSKEPLRTLSSYRKRDGAVWFGMNLIPRGTGSLEVGNTLRAVSTRFD